MKRRRIVLLGLALLVAAPMAGALTQGLRPGFFRYPPLVVEPPVHAGFSRIIFAAFAVLSVVFVCMLVRPSWFGFKRGSPHPTSSRSRLPTWGKLGLMLTAVSWVCAWGRFEWLGFMRNHMFAPLWFGYVLSIDGLVYHRKGSSLFSRDRHMFVMLFPLSAISWWYFEYLNRFMQNWWYNGIEGFGAGHYILYSSICFSTVLPAILGTYELVLTFRHFDTSFRRWVTWPGLPQWALVCVLMAGAVGLVLLGAFPDPFFFLTWLAPMAVLGASLGLSKIDTPFHPLRKGDYTMLIGLAVAALICGAFWETWNFFSLPKWRYAVPYVDTLHVFEMPIVGYGGYLPFGPICWCFWMALRVVMPGRWQKAE